MANPIIDFGAHFHPEPPEAFDTYHDFIDTADGAAICSDIRSVLERYRDSCVDHAVLSQPFYMGCDDAQATANANDALLDIVEAHEELFGLAAIPTAAGGEAAAAEFERALESGYNGGALETRSGGVELIDDELEPVFEVADRTAAPILVHPKLHNSLGENILDDTWRLNAIFGREVALAESICKVIHEGVYDNYPDLRLVFHHNGGNIASMLPRIHLQLDDGRWPGLEGLKSYDEFEAQLTQCVFLDSSGYFGERATFRQTLDSFPSSQFLFATDFPYETRKTAVIRKFVDSFEEVCSSSDAERILGGNALDLLVNV